MPDPHLLQSDNAPMARALATAQRVAAADIPVLLIGESGTGKSLLASAIHRWSPRRNAPFVTVRCAALIEHRLERPLVEHLDGAISGVADAQTRPEAVNGGTLFFDDVGDGALPTPLQIKLIDHLESSRSGSVEPEPNIRIVAAARRNAHGDLQRGGLSDDLFFDLAVATISLPPLRDRREDLPRLCNHFLARLPVGDRRAAMHLTSEAEQLLASYSWPGNLRELHSVLQRAVVLADGPAIGPDDLRVGLLEPAEPDRSPPTPPSSLAEIEQHQIRLVLRESGTLAEAAARLGIDPATLWRKRKRYGLEHRRGSS